MCLSLRLPVFYAVLACLQICLSVSAEAQELRQTLHDYHTDRPFYYQPNDPFTRSKVFNAQTGNFGLYYNCDGEECKRNSPYICWKLHEEKDIPPCVGIWHQLRLDMSQVRQRVQDGAGACYKANCRCSKCRKNVHPGKTRFAEVDQPTNNRPGTNETTQLVSKFDQPKKIKVAEKFGLISGKIVERRTIQPVESEQEPIRSASKPASKPLSLSDLIRQR